MASVSSKTEQIAHENLEEKMEVDDISKLDGEEKSATYSAIVSEEKPVSEDVSIVEGLEKSGKMIESETLEKIDVDSSSPTTIDVNVKDLQDETGMPEEEKIESSDASVLDVSETREYDYLYPPTATEVSVNDLEVQSAFPGEHKQEEITETQKPSSNEADSGGEVIQSSSHEEKGSGDAEAAHKKEESLEEITENPIKTLGAKIEVGRNSTDLSAAAEVSSDQERAPETDQLVEGKDMRFSIEATVKDLNIVPEEIEVPSKDEEVSASDERESESLKDVDAISVKSPKNFTIVEELPEQVIEKNENESSNDFETLESAAEVVKKDIGASEMVEDKNNDSKDHIPVEKNVQIPDDQKEETHLEEVIQIAADKSEKEELGAEKENSRKSNDVDPIASSEIKGSTKRKSNNFFSKAKLLIVKAKKAILGKSPGPKTMSSDIKDDDKS